MLHLGPTFVLMLYLPFRSHYFYLLIYVLVVWSLKPALSVPGRRFAT
jgi:hypothetical protein